MGGRVRRAAAVAGMIDFGIGKAASTAILALVGTAVAAGAVWWIVDYIGDKREAEIGNEFNRKRVEDLQKRLGTDAAVKELERRSKVWCAAGFRDCCGPGAGKLQQCTKDPSE